MTAALVGFALGWLGSMPVGGPVSLLVVRRGAAGRYRGGLALAAGAALAEAGWCAAALFGYGALLDRWPWLRPVTGITGAVVLLAVGGYILLMRPARVPDPAAPAEAERGTPRDFVLGFTLLALNPSVMLSWLAGLAAIQAAGIRFTTALERGLFVGTAALGIVAWFGLVLHLFRLGRHRVAPHHLARAVRGVGALLCVLGLGTLVGLLRG